MSFNSCVESKSVKLIGEHHADQMIFTHVVKYLRYGSISFFGCKYVIHL